MRRISSLEVLRLRAPNPVQPVILWGASLRMTILVELRRKTFRRLALMGPSPGLGSAVPSGLHEASSHADGRHRASNPTYFTISHISTNSTGRRENDRFGI